MKKWYYIQELPSIQKSLDSNSNALVAKENQYLINLETEEDKLKFINAIKEIEFINDGKLIDITKTYFPEAENYLKTIPISHPNLTEAVMFIFHDSPPDYFEGDNALEGLRKVLNHTIKKNTTGYLLQNLNNDLLLYDENWKHRKFQEFYFMMMYVVFSLETYYDFF